MVRGAHLDAEYFSYVLLAAAQKYRKDLEEGTLSYFYEVLFHSLNLNTLAVEGNLFDFKMNPIWKDERILKIKDDLKKIYEDTNSETVEIFRNANFVFLSVVYTTFLPYPTKHKDLTGLQSNHTGYKNQVLSLIDLLCERNETPHYQTNEDIQYLPQIVQNSLCF